MASTLIQAKQEYSNKCDRLRDISSELQAMLDSNGQMNAADTAIADELSAEADALTAEVKDLRTRFPACVRVTQSMLHVSPSRRRGNPYAATSKVVGDPADYCQLHGLKASDLDDGGFQSFGEFLSVFGSGMLDNRIVGMRAAAATNFSAAGGALVPEKFLAESLHPAGEAELIMPRARTFSMNEGTLRISTLDNLSNADGEMYGGFSAQWVPEGEEFTEMTPETSGLRLHRKKLGLFTVASNELISDSQYEQQLVPALQSAISDFRDYAFLTGDGVGKPMGILNDVAMITVDKESGQAADSLVIANLDKMYARLHPRLVRNAAWYVNPTAIPQLLALVRATGTSGTVVPVLNEASGSFSMYGLPVLLTSKLPVLGDAGDILLADVSQYAIGMGRGIVIDRSEHVRFQRDQTAWRAVWRGDGVGRWRSVYTPRNGDTQSWCVKLAARA